MMDKMSAYRTQREIFDDLSATLRNTDGVAPDVADKIIDMAREAVGGSVCMDDESLVGRNFTSKLVAAALVGFKDAMESFAPKDYDSARAYRHAYSRMRAAFMPPDTSR